MKFSEGERSLVGPPGARQGRSFKLIRRANDFRIAVHVFGRSTLAGGSSSVALLNVKVAPGARQSEIVGRYGDGIKVRVAALAEDSRANQALIELLARALNVPKSAVRIVRGQTSKDKVLEIAELSFDQILLRLGV